MVEAPVALRCCECGTGLELSARNAREHRRKGTLPRCRRCRYPSSSPKPSVAMRRWWLERFSQEEIIEMAAALWPSA